jgi:hypothetical protein
VAPSPTAAAEKAQGAGARWAGVARAAFRKESVVQRLESSYCHEKFNQKSKESLIINSIKIETLHVRRATSISNTQEDITLVLRMLEG